MPTSLGLGFFTHFGKQAPQHATTSSALILFFFFFFFSNYKGFPLFLTAGLIWRAHQQPRNKHAQGKFSRCGSMTWGANPLRPHLMPPKQNPSGDKVAHKRTFLLLLSE